jgi:carbonic anhydrase/acetyltransferase-like protein (isoleucine patch superfamily)
MLPRFAVLLPPRSPIEGLEGPLDVQTLPEGTVQLARADALRRHKLELRAWGAVPLDAPRLLLRSDAVVSAAALAGLLAAGGPSDRALQIGGATGALLRQLAFDDALPTAAVLSDGQGDPLDRLQAARAVELDPKERLHHFALAPGQFDQDSLTLPISDLLALPVRHWIQLLWANLLRLPAGLLRQISSANPLIFLPQLLGAAWRSQSLRPLAVGGAMRRVGRGSRIHPSAVVEASWLGRGVTVGAGAVVRGCVLHDGSAVEEHGLVEGCVLAPRARVQRKAMIKFSLIGAGAMAAGYMQLGVLDNGAAFKLTSALMDQAFGGPVELNIGGQRRPAPMGLAGVCVGARTVVGAGVLVAPGRTIPPDLQIMPTPALVLRRLPSAATGRALVEDGGLRLLDPQPAARPA